jgi:D-alanine-D-alanine ligase
MLLPHRVVGTLLITFPDEEVADQIEAQMREILGKGGPKWKLVLDSNRPPMKDRTNSTRLAKTLLDVAEKWEIPLKRESSTLPSVAGVVPAKTACVCGIGPVAHNLGMPSESVSRISLVQRTLLLAEFLAAQLEK